MTASGTTVEAESEGINVAASSSTLRPASLYANHLVHRQNLFLSRIMHLNPHIMRRNKRAKVVHRKAMIANKWEK